MKKITILVIINLIALNMFAQQSEEKDPLSLSIELNKNVPTIKLDALDLQALLIEDAETQPMGMVERTAKIRPVNLNLYNSGVWTELENGDRIWRLVIESKEAYATTFLYEDFYLPEGASLHVYSPDYKQVIGAFTSFNNHESRAFTTELIHGESAVIEYFEPANQAFKGSLTVDGVAHFYKQLPSEFDNLGYGDSESCQINVNCSEGNAWQDEKKGVARIFVVSSQGGGWCTGSLVNNTNQDCTPYFLTAYHCGENSSTGNFNNWVFYFNYESAGCNNVGNESTILNSANYFSVTGASVVAQSTSISNGSDMMLLEFNNTINSNEDVYYNGWDRTSIATVTSNGVSIHHPGGDIKKISTYTQSLTTQGYGTNLQTHYRVVWASTANGQGSTEGGSSGSPIFNDQGLIIGTLTGGSSCCVTNGCGQFGSGPNLPDFYGTVSYHWNSNGNANNRRVDVHLDPASSGAATSLAGSASPCSATAALDAGILSITEPSTNTCGSNITPIVELRNYGSTALTSCQIRYQITGGALQTYNWTGNLATSSNATVTLGTVSASNGTNTFTAYTQSPNGGVDGNTGNDSKSVSFSASAGTPLPLVQTFQNATFPPTNYSISNADSDVTWERTTTAGFNSTASMFVDNWDYNGVGAYDWFVLPAADLSNETAASLTYDYAYAYYDGTQGTFYDSLIVAYSLDCGNSWFGLSFEGGVQLATAGGQGTEFVPTSTDWESVVLDLSATSLIGESNVTLAFVAVNGYGNNLYVDNINFQSNSSTQTPVAEFTSSSTAICSGETVLFTNQSTQSPTSYSWSFPGGTPATSTQASPSVVYANPGTYTVTLTATNIAGSDIETKTNLVVVDAGPILNLTSVGATCSGLDDGSATVLASGGSGNYTYSWTNSASVSPTAANLPPGTYAVTVTDLNACSSTATTNITAAVNINIQLSVTDSSALGGVSSIVSNVSGGATPYVYAWDNGAISADLIGLSPGWYELTVTDINGCQGKASASIGNVAIKNPEWLSYISLYPNPASNVLNMDLSLESKQDLNYQIYNTIGQVMHEKTLENFQSGLEKINLSDVADGVYFIKLSDNTNTKVMRFIKR